FNNAAANNDVMYISESSTSSNVSIKARDLDIGTVDDECWLWDSMEYGATGDGGGDWGTTINITDNSHYITSPFSTGSLTVFTTGGNLNNLPSSLASGGQLLGQTPNGGDPTLFAFDTGAALDSGTAANRRVGFPSFDTDPSLWTADLKTLFKRSVEWAAGCGGGGVVNPCGTNLVMVTGDGTFTGDADDTAKKALFESWGWTVTAIEDQYGDYSGAASSNDVMFISESANSSSVGTQATNLNIGIVVEEAALQDEMELCGSQNYTSGTTGTQIDIVDNTHYIASTLSTGAVLIYSSTDSLIINQATPAPGAIVVAEGIGGNNTALVAIPTGATLDNGASAANRRVGFTAMHESTPANWTSSMQALVARSLEWAAGCGADGGGTNSDPVLNSIGNKSVDEGQLLQFTISATDPDTGDTLTYSASNLPTGASFDPGTQTFSWTPNVGDAGTYPNVLFTVQDDATPQGSDSESITITVNSTGGGGVGIPITAGDVADYSCNMKITIDNTKVAFTTPQDFPVLISLTDDSLKTSGCGFMTDPDGDDLIFTNSNLTLQLYHEIEKYDGTTGELVAWVLVPSLSGTVDTDIYMYFGNSNVTSPTESPTDVWDSNYKGVWHLKEDAAMGTSGSFDRSVAAQEDDAEELLSDGSIDLSSSDLELIRESGDQVVGMRFLNMTIPPGATITNAYVEFAVDETTSETTNLTFWGQDADNPGTFTSGTYNISNRIKTSASVAWNTIPSWDTVGETKQTPNLKTIIQEIVDRPGWTSGNAMVIIVTGTGKRVADSYSDVAPLLHVEYGSTADFHFDSTSNNNDGTPHGNSLTASGKIDGAQDFDGYNDYITVPDSSSLHISDYLTVEAWIRPDTNYVWQTIVSKMYNQTEHLYFVLDDSSSSLYLGLNNVRTDWDTGDNVSINSWHHVAFAYNGSATRVYLDGSQVAYSSNSGTLTLGSNSHPLYIGYNEGWTNEVWHGQMDEVRISNTTRSAEWIQTSYNNQNSPSSFYSIEKNCPGTIPPIAEFSCSIPITIDSTKVSGTSDLINFPVLISLTDIGLKTTANCGHVQNSNGYDIIFSDATQTTVLAHEIETYDGTAGKLVAWVRVPTLSATSDTTIYLHFGHSGVCGATENPQGVWDSNYMGVWHLHDDFEDSTSNNNDGTNNDTTSATGKIANSRSFDGSSDYIQVADSTSLDVTSQLTMEAWVNLSNADNNQKIVGKTNSTYSSGYLIGVQTGQYPEIWNSGGTNHTFTSGSISSSQWTHLVTTWTTGGNMIGYINGSQVNSIAAGSYDIGTNAGDLIIGAAPWNPDSYETTGRIDEIRISSTARSADWIQTEYNNQSDPSSFYSVGASDCFFLSGFSC
ncbi:MAG: DUF2341 domain-containing protein, partial [Deltaproteobacteria bacterium]|nr:DUF2341 domain-containing protein [Deltaproteobacteria bacterium]